MAIKLKKTLYIGLGGTGVAALLKIKKCFIDSYGEIPPMIGFLAIDTDTAALNKEETSNLGASIKLDAKELFVCTVKNALPTYKNNPTAYDWVPSKNVNNLRNIAGLGAGQVRSNGRFIAYYNYRDIQTNIASAITKIHQLIPHNSPYTVDTNKDGVEYATTINVFASVAGGTGSGMLIDTLCLINKTMKELALQYNLYPWIVLPEIFKSMNNGPAMANVWYNSYGTLRCLDYMQHLDPNDPAINFGYTTVSEPLFNYAFVLNNFNQAGVSFNKLNDLVDVIAKSAFLPANKMGDEILSPFDNIRHQQDGGVYNILNKRAWAASTGSAELIYDNQAIGRAYAYQIISQLCRTMMQTTTNGADEANRFVDDANVLIRENNGRDDVINALLNPNPEYPLQIDKDTNISDFQFYFDRNAGEELDVKIKNNYEEKLEKTNTQFESVYLPKLLDGSDGCVGKTLAFVKALKSLIGLCKGEMETERKELNERNIIPMQWEEKLASIRNTGIKALVGGPIDKDGAESLSQEVGNYVMNLREEKRRIWAIRFYNAFEETVDTYEKKLQNIVSLLTGVQNKYTGQLLAQQNLTDSTSKFQIFLHKDDVYRVSDYMLKETEKAGFQTYFSSKGGLIRWLNMSQEQIDMDIWNFAKDTTPVANAVNRSIDDVLNAMNPEDVKHYLEQLKILAAPLWSYNTQGYNQTQLMLDRFVIVGVGNRDTSILANDKRYNTIFNTNGNTANYASTHQNDRIYVLVVEDLLPIYAINNYTTYKSDYELKVANNHPMAAYLDEKLHNRMQAENFDIMPTVEQDNVLQLWVWGFVFGYIHYDETDGYYWIRSKSHGDPIQKYRFNLNSQRDVAFDVFKTEGLYHEFEQWLEEKIKRDGEQVVQQRIQEVKDNETYLDECANLSKEELTGLNNPKFKSVRNLINQEIELMSN